MKSSIQLSWFFVTAIETIAGGWIPHIPPPESPYEMTLSLVNESDTTQVFHFFPFDEQGVALTSFQMALAPHTFQTQPAHPFFEPITSHVRVGSTNGQVLWSYDLKGRGKGQPLFRLHPGTTYRALTDWRHGVDGAFGLSLVNTSDELAMVDVRVMSAEKSVQRLEIQPRAKALIRDEQFDDYDQVVIEIESSQRLAITAAQRSWSGENSHFFPRDLLLEQQIPSQDLVDIRDGVLRQMLLSLLDNQPEDGQLTRFEMEKLESLNCAKRGIRSLEGLQAATNLKVLHCDRNIITDARPIDALLNLESLDLSDNPVIHLPRLAESHVLSVLIANRLGLTEFIPDWYQLPLKELSLVRNQIDAFDFQGFTDIETVNLEQNPGLQLLSTNFPQSLRSLDLRYCGLTENDFSNSSIETLDLGVNPGLSGKQLLLPQTLHVLELDYCGMDSFFYELPQLETLDLSGNQMLTSQNLSLPETLRSLELRACDGIVRLDHHLPRLSALDISDSDIILSPAQYESLKVLKMNYAKQTSFPMQIQSLGNLEEVYASRGRLEKCDALLALPNLKIVDVVGNYLGADQCTVIETLINRGVEVSYRYQNHEYLNCPGGTP
ncbi:MAG: leucine-rich repeat domain-containing protein [Acidobacteria bacterium]|nr:leucine-rich repeat domain-containing protein [Acidobacteriota bacterium]